MIFSDSEMDLLQLVHVLCKHRSFEGLWAQSKLKARREALKHVVDEA